MTVCSVDCRDIIPQSRLRSSVRHIGTHPSEHVARPGDNQIYGGIIQIKIRRMGKRRVDDTARSRRATPSLRYEYYFAFCQRSRAHTPTARWTHTHSCTAAHTRIARHTTADRQSVVVSTPKTTTTLCCLALAGRWLLAWRIRANSRISLNKCLPNIILYMRLKYCTMCVMYTRNAHNWRKSEHGNLYPSDFVGGSLMFGKRTSINIVQWVRSESFAQFPWESVLCETHTIMGYTILGIRYMNLYFTEISV